MFKTDCVMAEIHNGSCACSGLTETLCITKGKCKFYKTKKNGGTGTGALCPPHRRTETEGRSSPRLRISAMH